MAGLKQEFVHHLRSLQDQICAALESSDGAASFHEDLWDRTGGGGGRTRIIQRGPVIEKGGVNFSEVYGKVTPAMETVLKVRGDSFYATGLSLVIHPLSPFVPTVHANFRYFEILDERKRITNHWFGGGMDLTPYYLIEENAAHFHQTLKDGCDRFSPKLYPEFKKNCDQYFVNAHRNHECRGIGGIFYDHCNSEDGTGVDWLQFSKAISESFIPAYIPIVESLKHHDFDSSHKYWQEIRRGRYVEFNLVHDRGTLFGLRSDGRTESILMSLPPTVRFDYNYQPLPGSEEEKLQNVCLHPREWVATD